MQRRTMLLVAHLLLLITSSATTVFGNLATDRDLLQSTNLCHIAFIQNDAQAISAVSLLQEALDIPKTQSHAVHTDADILEEFNRFASNVDESKVSLFVVDGLHNIDTFLARMNFLHTVTDSNSPYANVVVLLLWNIALQSPELLPRSAEASMADDSKYAAEFIDKWKESIISTWNRKHHADVNGDAIIGRISRMAIFPVDRASQSDISTVASKAALDSLFLFESDSALDSSTTESLVLMIRSLLPSTITPMHMYMAAGAVALLLIVFLVICRRKRPSKASARPYPNDASFNQTDAYAYSQHTHPVMYQHQYSSSGTQLAPPPTSSYSNVPAVTPYGSIERTFTPRGSGNNLHGDYLAASTPPIPQQNQQRSQRPTPNLPNRSPLNAFLAQTETSVTPPAMLTRSASKGHSGSSSTPVIDMSRSPTINSPGRSVRKRSGRARSGSGKDLDV